MKIIFFGTSKFAIKVLKKLVASPFSVISVVTQPDKKSGRNLKMSVSPVKSEAERLRIPVYQPQDISDENFVENLENLNTDLFVVIGFGSILPKEILDIPKICSLNVHPSLLPKYRGAAPINWAVINGEKETGVTIIRMNEKMDAGDIALQKKIKIKSDDTSETLNTGLAQVGAQLLMDAVISIENGKAHFTAQDEKSVTFAPKLTKKDGILDWSLDANVLIDRIRGLKPWPGTYSFLDGKVIKIISANILESEFFSRFSPGEVITADEKTGLIVKTGKGALSVSQIQLEGKKEMPVALFLRGRNIKIGTRLGG